MSRKKIAVLVVMLFTGVLGLEASASTDIKQHDEDTLLVTHYSGKPPHRKMYIHKDKQPEIYERYYAMMKDQECGNWICFGNPFESDEDDTESGSDLEQQD